FTRAPKFYYSYFMDNVSYVRVHETGKEETTFDGADILLNGITPEEKRFFRNRELKVIPEDGSIYSIPFDSANPNFTRYLIKTHDNEVTDRDWRDWYNMNYRPMPIQKRIIDMMVKASSDKTLVKRREVTRGRQIKCL